MTAPQKPQDHLEVLLDAHLAELMAMSDAEVLDGADPAEVQTKGLMLLSAAKVEAGRRRLAAAKAKIALIPAHGQVDDASSVSALDARAFLREAVNSGMYTLAARGLDEMSDADAIRLCDQLRRLSKGLELPKEDAP